MRMDVKELLPDPGRLAEAVAGHITSFTEGTL
jgi:cyclic pyranopterin phosphate synthase